MTSRSQQWFAQALKVLPGGVNSPVRAFNGVGGTPLYFVSGEGAWLTDADGQRYVDYIGSWGPAIVGHAHPQVLAAVGAQLAKGLGFGAPNELETALAERIVAALPSAEKVRMVSSGTEAAMTAIRLARGITGRERIVKFEGCYHGHADSLLVKAGSGALTLGVPTSPGVPAALAELTTTLNYNDSAQVKQAFDDFGDTIAAVIVEPVAGNMNCIPPVPGFLETLRDVTTRHGTLLIFDEVMTGFRVHAGGAQSLYGIRPDLTVLGKIIGGGLPVGAVAGPARHMDKLAPLGPVYQAGTLSGNPLAMACGLATLALISQPGFHDKLAAQTKKLCVGIEARARSAGVALVTNHVGGMFGLFFSEHRVDSFARVMACDVERFKRFFHAMLAQGVNLAPSAFEAGFVSAAHGDAEIAHTLEAVSAALAASGRP